MTKVEKWIMNDLDTKIRVIRTLSSWELKCLFCEKKDDSRYNEHWEEKYNKDGKGIFLCGKCQGRYNLLKEIDEERRKIKNE